MEATPMKDKTVLVTGATAGIGKMTALEIARHGANTIIVGRNKAKCEDVVSMIKRDTGNDTVTYMLADQSSISQTKALAQQFINQYDRLDVLVNNVGSLFMSRGETEDGFENTFALNHLVGYFLLTHLLLVPLKASGSARIVNVSSDAHYQSKMNFDDLEKKQRYNGFGAYAQSKLANVMFTYELARQLDGSGVTANALHPGVVASNFGYTNNAKWYLRIFRKIFDIFSISEADGAKTSIYLATSSAIEGVTGKFFDKCAQKPSSPASLVEADQRRLWEISEQMLGLN